MGKPKRLNRDTFTEAVRAHFPEIAATWDESDDGLLHLEVAAFRRCVEAAMDAGRLWDVERYCRFIESCRDDADDALENAIGVSFIEDFAFGEINEQRRKAVHERMPKNLRASIIAIASNWQ